MNQGVPLHTSPGQLLVGVAVARMLCASVSIVDCVYILFLKDEQRMRGKKDTHLNFTFHVIL